MQVQSRIPDGMQLVVLPRLDYGRVLGEREEGKMHDTRSNVYSRHQRIACCAQRNGRALFDQLSELLYFLDRCGGWQGGRCGIRFPCCGG